MVLDGLRHWNGRIKQVEGRNNGVKEEVLGDIAKTKAYVRANMKT